MNIKFQDDIDKLLLNRMSAVERLKFQLLYGWRSEVKDQISFTQDVMCAIKSRNNKLAQIKEWEEEEKESVLMPAAADIDDNRERKVQEIKEMIVAIQSDLEHEEKYHHQRIEDLYIRINDIQRQIDDIIGEFKVKTGIISDTIKRLEDELKNLTKD